jgi:general secretion pathway protein C
VTRHRTCFLHCVGISARTFGVNLLSSATGRIQALGQSDLTLPTAILAVVICAWSISDLVGLLLDRVIPPPSISRLSSRANQRASQLGAGNEIIATRNLFGLEMGASGPNPNAEPVPTSLPIAVVGVVIFQDPARSMAAIQDNSESKLYPVRAGDEVPGKMKVLTVDQVRVVFINLTNQVKEFIAIPEDKTPKISRQVAPISSIDDSSGIRKAGDTQFKVKRSELEGQLSNFDTLIREARAEPEFQGGAFAGFRLKEIKPGSFYEKIGLRVGDLIQGANGEKITDIARAMQLMNSVSTMSSLKLSINRSGKVMVLNYDIES